MSNQNTENTLIRIEQLSKQGSLQEAEQLCDELSKRAPREPRAWAWLGFLALRGGRLADAESALHQAAKLDRYNASYWSSMEVVLDPIVFGFGLLPATGEDVELALDSLAPPAVPARRERKISVRFWLFSRLVGAL